MTEAEKNSFFAHSSQRAPGKRQIKPTAAMADLVLPADEDEDDEDFKAGSASGSDEGESSESSSSGEEDDEEGDEDTKDTVVAEMDLGPPICSLCFNLRQATAKDEIIQCDKCGITVHELCYTSEPEVGRDDESTESASSTEPWFCEPCIYGESEPPHCELCPVRYGAFKRSDMGGRWVHLVCALYTPGMTFGDTDRLTAVSWQEVDHKKFGRKACSGCSDRLESRTGIVTGCDAAMCKNYYHATCAQRLGFLVDRGEDATYAPSDEGNDERFIHCKKHSHEEEVRIKKEKYAQFVRQEERRFATMFKRKRLNEREEQKRKKELEKSRAVFKRLEGITIAFPDQSWDKIEKKMRRARQLHTSAKYLEAFAEKAELAGIPRDEFEKAFVKVNGATLSFLPPGFSPEFIAYFNHREKHVMGAEKAKLEKLQKEEETLTVQQNSLQDKFKELEEEHAQSVTDLHKANDRLTKLHVLLTQLGVKKLAKLADIVKKDVAAAPRGRLLSKSSVTSDGPSSSAKTAKIVIHACATCKQQRDQHQIVECDACHSFYHLSCLDPPLERMPKRGANFEWHCSDCVPDSDSDRAKSSSHSPELGVDDEDEVVERKRNLRQRSNSERFRKMQEREDEARAYKSAIIRGSNCRRFAKSRNSTPATKPSPLLPPQPPLSVHLPSPSVPSLLSSPDSPTKRGRGRPRKNAPPPPASSEPMRSPVGSTGSLPSPRSKKARLSLSPSAAKKNARVLHDAMENGEDSEDEMEPFVIIKD